MRALLADDRDALEERIAPWPEEIRAYALPLAFGSLAQPDQNPAAGRRAGEQARARTGAGRGPGPLGPRPAPRFRLSRCPKRRAEFTGSPIITLTMADGVDLAWDGFGDPANETVLLISGLGSQRIRWTAAFCEALAARGYHVLRFDNRDAGGSTHLSAAPPPDFAALAAALAAGRRPDVPCTLEDMAADAIGLLDALGVARAHVVGRSMGGMIAQVLASDHADRVLSLTSIMSSTGDPALPQAAPDVLAMMMRPAPDPTLDPDGFLASRLAFARRIAGTAWPFNEEVHRALLLEEARRSHDPAGTARQMAALAAAGDRRARLATIVAPALVLHGTDDPLIPPACGQDTALSIPGAIYRPIQGMGHDLPPELDRTVIDAICDVAEKASRRLGA